MPKMLKIIGLLLIAYGINVLLGHVGLSAGDLLRGASLIRG